MRLSQPAHRIGRRRRALPRSGRIRVANEPGRFRAVFTASSTVFARLRTGLAQTPGCDDPHLGQGRSQTVSRLWHRQRPLRAVLLARINLCPSHRYGQILRFAVCPEPLPGARHSCDRTKSGGAIIDPTPAPPYLRECERQAMSPAASGRAGRSVFDTCLYRHQTPIPTPSYA